jgi:DNA-binding CsgD family transcriptional regulator
LHKQEVLTDDLIETIHAALLGETDWQSFVDRLNGIAPGALSTLFFHDADRNGGTIAYVAGTEGREKALESYESYYSKLNPWMRKVAATPLGKGIVGEQIVTREAFNGSEYYNDYIRPNGLETGIGLTMFRDEHCYFVVSMLTGDRDTDRNLKRAELLTSIAPSLSRAFSYYRSGAYHAAALDLGEAIASDGKIGLLLVNEHLRIVKTSAAAERALASGNVIGVDPLGRVRFKRPEVQAALHAMLERESPERTARSYSYPHFDLRLIRVGGTKAAEFFAGPMVAILLGGQTGELHAKPAQLARNYGLSPAEVRVFMGIVSGDNVTAIAKAAGIGRETVRSQLKSIYAKTGTHSQSDIVRLASGLIRPD